MNVVVLGIDLGKNSCSVVELDAAGRVLRGLVDPELPAHWRIGRAMTRAEAKALKLVGASRRLPLQTRAWARSRRDRANLTVPTIRSRGLIRLGEAAPVLRAFRDRMRARAT